MATAELRVAIRERNVVRFHYAGCLRVVHPHAIFIASTGSHCLDGVQVDGHSTSGTLPGWRRFDVNKIDDVAVTGESFEIDPEFEVRARDYRRGIVVASVQ